MKNVVNSASLIRNFCIIAHIDHGKSTLADRLIEFTGTIPKKHMREQVLDQMDLERERGITIKLAPVTMKYTARDGSMYTLNLLDTPGHVDFSYEVSRSLAACEGALLVVDATQGVEAQTLAHGELAKSQGLKLIPVINKIDLQNAQVEKVIEEIRSILGFSETPIPASAKEGIGVEEILNAIVTQMPAPKVTSCAPLKCLIFDSRYDTYRGVVVSIRVFEGSLRAGEKIMLFSSKKNYTVEEVGVFRPFPAPQDMLSAGHVGYVMAGIKNVRDVHIGDTLTSAAAPCREAYPGYRKIKPMVFCGLYPVENAQFHNLKDALEKLGLNDASFTYEPETSRALGFGFRCGFLGLLHMEIIQERLEREYNLELVATVPSVVYRVQKRDKTFLDIDNPAKLPQGAEVEALLEPYVRSEILLPQDYVGAILKLCQERRGEQKQMEFFGTRVRLVYEFPLSEILFDFFDKLKSFSSGYASFDYEFMDYREQDLVKLDILVGGQPVDALSFIVHRSKAYHRGRALVTKLRKLIPRHLFEVPVQAAIGSKVIARENIAPLRKDVTAKCYGGDVTRKRKLLEKQKEGKKRMKQVGRVEIPQEAFLAVLSTEE